METILVGTDFGVESYAAFAQACVLAKALGSRVHLLHILALVDDPGSPDPDTQEFYARLTEAAQTKLAAQIQKAGAGLPTESSVEIGSRSKTLLKVALSLQAGLIVVGSKPLTPGSDRLSVSHRLALVSTLPIMLVPQAEPLNDLPHA